jgi:Ca2+-binding RTX toxin-like protein
MTYTYGGSTSGYVNPLSVVTITGGEGTNTLTGSAGHDYISGLGGNDVLTGNAGFDVLQGGLGSDTFTFQVGLGFDTVKDFTYGGVDKIDLPSTIGYSDLSFSSENGGIAIIYQGNVWMHLLGQTTAPPANLFI